MTSYASFSQPTAEPGSAASEKSQGVFKTLKDICVPLLSNSLLTAENILRVSQLLSRLLSFLNSITESQHILSPAIISYVFFPLSHILQRNTISAIPDVIMEKIMDVLAALFEQWWWTCPTDAWEQILMLSAAIFGGINPSVDVKGKGKERDDETKRAAASCLWTVIRQRDQSGISNSSDLYSSSRAEARFNEFQARGRMPKLLPMFGQTLTSLLEAAQSANRKLQTLSLLIIKAMIVDYLPSSFLPSVLPGVISAMVKVVLGRREGKGWSNGDTVCLALKIMQETIVRTIGDEICQSDGAIRTISGLEDLASSSAPDEESHSVVTSAKMPTSSLSTPRTSVWLSASASQLHIALNALSPLLSHPNPGALTALSQFSQVVASNTNQTLPDTQPLLLSFLLSLSTSSFPGVADISHGHLLTLLSPASRSCSNLLQILMQTTQDNLSALPRVLPSYSDSKVEHFARQVSAVCQLAKDVHAVSVGVGRLLGVGGGIEKWGWSLLTALELSEPPLFISSVQPSQALLEGVPETAAVRPFPPVQMKYVASLSTREELDRMFRALGAAAGPECLFSVEWFVGVARCGKGTREVTALWCASKLLEGVGGVSIDSPEMLRSPLNKRVEKVARWIANVVSELWDQPEKEENENIQSGDFLVGALENDGRLPLEYVKGLYPLITRFDLNNGDKHSDSFPRSQRILHDVLCLRLLSVTSAILQSRFARLLLYTLYPVLRSLVSENTYLSSTALAALHLITATTAYATPSNLLLANFDYALDSVGRRLDRRHLDPEATKILVVLIRLVGKDIVSRAGDVVEACFDRLDEFHGYGVLVEGLVEVLAEVVKVVETDNGEGRNEVVKETLSEGAEEHIETFFSWYQHRNDPQKENAEHYGRAPRMAWGTGKGKEKETFEGETSVPLNSTDIDEESPTPTQVLTKQIVMRSIYFLTHSSPFIRARILDLLDAASQTLSESNLLPSIHTAWPYILNRLADSEPFVVGAAASLIASLAEHAGDFMSTRIWNDVWPRFRRILSKLEVADSQNALARRDPAAVGTESAYSHSHRLYASLLRTMCAVVTGVQLRQDILWEILVAFRRFLHIGVHEELQLRAREVYRGLLKNNEDTVWLVFSASIGEDVMGSYDGNFVSLKFLTENKWDIEANAKIVLGLS